MKDLWNIKSMLTVHNRIDVRVMWYRVNLELMLCYYR